MLVNVFGKASPNHGKRKISTASRGSHFSTYNDSNVACKMRKQHKFIGRSQEMAKIALFFIYGWKL
jgi:hypothetical protein